MKPTLNTKTAASTAFALLLTLIGCSKDHGLSGSRLLDNGPTAGSPAAVPSPASGPIRNPANGHYYALYVNDGAAPMLYADAKSRAQAAGGYLATLTSQEENDFVQTHIHADPNVFTFLGGVQEPGSLEPAGGWRWDNGEPWDYTNWSFGEPNNSSPLGYEDNLQIYLFDDFRNGRWNDIVDTAQDLGGICNSYLVEWDHAPNSDTTPPSLTGLSVSPSTLWPPNHKMRDVTVTAFASDDRDPAPGYRILSITSNQPEAGTGDGDSGPDSRITGDRTAQIRAERAADLGDRIYTITVEARDAAGNTASASVQVTVPRNQ